MSKKLQRARIEAELRRILRLWPVPVAMAVAVAFWLAMQWGGGHLDGRRGEVTERLATYRNAIESGRRQRRERPEVDAAIDGFAVRTLGNTVESVDSAVRSRLNRVGEESGLGSLVVSTRPAVPRGTPAKSEFSRSGSQRALRDEIDFVEVPASLVGQGSLENLLRAVHRIEQEPWIKRIDSVSFGMGSDPAKMQLEVRLTTLFLPGATVPENLEASLESQTPFDRYATLLAFDPFSLPKPPEPSPAPKPRPRKTDPPPPPPSFPYGDWVLTGLIEGAAGPEAWLARRSSDERVALVPQARIGEAVLVAVGRDAAEFLLGEERFRVPIGGTLAERRPVPEGGAK